MSMTWTRRCFKVEERSFSYDKVVDGTTRSVQTTYCFYIGKDRPLHTPGVPGDIFLDLVDYEVRAVLPRGSHVWEGRAWGSAASEDMEIHWEGFKTRLCPHPSVIVDQLSSSSSRYLWCNEDGVYWWTEDEIYADLRKVCDVPSNIYLREHGRWIVRQLVARKYSHLEHLVNTECNAAHDSSNNDSTGTSDVEAGPTSEKQQLQRISVLARPDRRSNGASSSPSGTELPEQYEGPLAQVQEYISALLLSTIQNTRQEVAEDTTDLQRRLKTAESEAEKVKVDLLERDECIAKLETELKKARDTVLKQEQRYNALVDAQRQAFQMLQDSASEQPTTKIEAER